MKGILIAYQIFRLKKQKADKQLSWMRYNKYNDISAMFSQMKACRRSPYLELKTFHMLHCPFWLLCCGMKMEYWNHLVRVEGNLQNLAWLGFTCFCQIRNFLNHLSVENHSHLFLLWCCAMNWVNLNQTVRFSDWTGLATDETGKIFRERARSQNFRWG